MPQRVPVTTPFVTSGGIVIPNPVPAAATQAMAYSTPWLNGSTVLDQSRNLGTTRPQQPGWCVNFDGVDDRIQITSGNGIDIAALPISFSVWVYKDSHVAGDTIFRLDSSNDVNRLTLAFANTANQLLNVGGRFNNNTNGTITSHFNALLPAQWNHIAYVIDGDNANSYINGVKVSTAHTLTTPSTNLNRLWLGRSFNAGTEYDGRMFDFQLFDVALTDNEVEYLRTFGATGDAPTAQRVVWFKFDQAVEYNDILLDSSGNDVHTEPFNITISDFFNENADVPHSYQNAVGYRDQLDVLAIDETTWHNPSGAIITRNGDGSVDISNPTGGNVDVWFVDGANSGFINQFPLFEPISLSIRVTNVVGSLTFYASNTGPVSISGDEYDTTLLPNGVSFFLLRLGAGESGRFERLTWTIAPVPRDEANPTQDVTGAALDYTGRAPRNGKLIGSNCASLELVTGSRSLHVLDTGITGAMSVAVWFKSTTTQRFQEIIEIFGTSTSWFQLEYNTANSVNLKRRQSSANTYGVGCPVGNGEWHHLVLSAPDDTSMVFMFDGEVLFDRNDLPPLTFTNFRNLIMGETPGQYADARFYNKGLTVAEMLYLYSRGTEGTDPGTDDIVAHWPCSEGGGFTTHDASGNDHHGTLELEAESDIWANTQDVYHHNLTAGFNYAVGQIDAYDAKSEMDVIAFKVKTTDQNVILLHNPSVSGQFAGICQPGSGNDGLVDATSITIDGTTYNTATRGDLNTLLCDGVEHEVSMVMGGNFEDWTSIGIGNRTDTFLLNSGYITDVRINGVYYPYVGERFIPGATGGVTDANGDTLYNPPVTGLNGSETQINFVDEPNAPWVDDVTGIETAYSYGDGRTVPNYVTQETDSRQEHQFYTE